MSLRLYDYAASRNCYKVISRTAPNTWPAIPRAGHRRCAGSSGSNSEAMLAFARLRFRLLTGRLAPEAPGMERRRAGGDGVLRVLEDHLSDRQFMVGGRHSVADISLYAYVHVAHEAGFDLGRRRAIGAWLKRVEGTEGFIDDLQSYPRNSQAGRSRSIYD